MKEKRVVNIPIEVYERLERLAETESEKLGARITVPGMIGILSKEKEEKSNG